MANNYTNYCEDTESFTYHKYLDKITGKVYIIDMRPGNDEKLISIATSTGGEYLKYTTSDIEHLKSILSGHKYGEPLTDTDKDGFYDIEEEKIGIVRSNGERIFTSASKVDTDADGLKESKEVSKYFTTESSSSKVKKKYHKFYSLPDRVDSDGDGFLDGEDPNPLKSDVKITELKNKDYIKIKYTDFEEWYNNETIYSYGSSQDWFKNYTYLDDKKFNSAQKNGCGVIAIADLITYLSYYDSNVDLQKSGLYNNISKEYNYHNYMEYVIELMNRFPIYGELGNVNMQFPHISPNSVISYFAWPLYPYNTTISALQAPNSLYMELNARLSDYYSLRWNMTTDSKNTYNDIKQMINDNIPVVVSYDNTIDNKLGKVAKSILLYSSYKNIHDDECEKETVDSHYFTVTGIIEFSEYIDIDKFDIPCNTILQVSSWGRKYYVSFNDYVKQQNIFSNYLFIDRY